MTVENPQPWFGSKYQRLYRQALSGADIGEVGGVRDCFLQNSIIIDCYGNAEYSVQSSLSTKTGTVTLLRARGRLDNRQNEEVGAVMGFTDFGYWAVGWSAEAGNVYDTLEKSEDRTLLQHFAAEDQYHADYGDLNPIDRLENRENSEDTWKATYDGLMSGIAHNHNNTPVVGNARITAEFDWLNWLNAVDIGFTNIRGNGFTVSDITLPRIDGDCCNARQSNGYIAITGFELD